LHANGFSQCGVPAFPIRLLFLPFLVLPDPVLDAAPVPGDDPLGGRFQEDQAVGRPEGSQALKQPIGGRREGRGGRFIHRIAQGFGDRPISQIGRRAYLGHIVKDRQPPTVALRFVGLRAVEVRFENEIAQCAESTRLARLRAAAKAHQPLAEFGDIDVEPFEVIAEARDLTPEFGGVLTRKAAEPAD
jgi:hypothetical protein